MGQREPASGNHRVCDKTGHHLASAVDSESSTAAASDGDDYAVELIEGAAAGDARLQILASSTKTEVVTFVVAGKLTADQIELGQKRNGPMYDRGVTSRTIYLDGIRNDKLARAHINWLNEHGSQVRTRPTLPFQMLVVDQATLVLPLDLSGKQIGIQVHHNPVVVAGFQALFEQTWLSARPLGLTLQYDGAALSDTHRTVLELLALGNIDREIETKMAIDKRTVGRRVAEILRFLNAKTRLQAGVNAAKRGLV